MTEAVTLTWTEDQIAIIELNDPDSKVNTLKASDLEAFQKVLKEVNDKTPLGVVFTSAKPDNFIAGADISMLDACETAADAE